MAASKPVEAAMVSAAGPGSGSGVGGGSATSGPDTGSLPRWQLALAVGAPLLLGAGALYLWSRQRRRRETGARGDSGGLKRNSERKTPEGRASPAPGSGHPDGPGTHLEMVRSSPGHGGRTRRVQPFLDGVVPLRGLPIRWKLPSGRAWV